MTKILKIVMYVVISVISGFVFALGFYWGERAMKVLDDKAGSMLEARAKTPVKL